MLHYCVANMPGAYSRTATQALNNVTHPWTVLIADLGLQAACKVRPDLLKGINTAGGKLTCKPVADAHELSFTDRFSKRGETFHVLMHEGLTDGRNHRAVSRERRFPHARQFVMRAAGPRAVTQARAQGRVPTRECSAVLLKRVEIRR